MAVAICLGVPIGEVVKVHLLQMARSGRIAANLSEETTATMPATRASCVSCIPLVAASPPGKSRPVPLLVNELLMRRCSYVMFTPAMGICATRVSLDRLLSRVEPPWFMQSA